jgi:hypothetical protein
MKNIKSLSPIIDRKSRIGINLSDPSNQDLESIGRSGRDNLKQFLSSDALKIPKVPLHRPSGLSADVISLSSPKANLKTSDSSLISPSATDKFLRNLVKIKHANKNILNAFMNPKSQLKQFNQQGQSPVRLSIREELKIFEKAVQEKSEALHLTEWFDFTIKKTLIGANVEKSFFENDSEEQGKALKSAEDFLKEALNKFLMLIRSRNNETSLLVNKLFTGYQRYWEVLLVVQAAKSERTVQGLVRDLEKQKSEFVTLAKKAKQKILSVMFIQLKARLKDNEEEIKIKDLQLEKIIREEVPKKYLENYEKIIHSLKKKVGGIMDLNNKNLLKDKNLAKAIMSEFQVLDKFKSVHLLEKKKLDDQEELCKSHKSIQTSIETSDKETMLSFVYFNAETQTYGQVFDNQNQETSAEVDSEIRDLQQAGYIPENAEIISWSAGYFTGLARGRSIAQREALQAEELMDNLNTNESSFELSEDEEETLRNNRLTKYEMLVKKYEDDMINEIDERTGEEMQVALHFEHKDDAHLRDSEKKETFFKRMEKKRRATTTKFKEFNFQRREKIVIQKKVKSKKVREFIMKKSLHELDKRKKMSRKMLVKIINNFYTSLIKAEEVPEDLLEYVYTEFETKNSLKKVVQRKVIDFLANLLQNSSVLKIKNFIKFLNFSKKIKEASFINVKDSLSMYLTGFDSVFKSKLGLMPDFNDFSETNLVPVIRISEFYRDYFSENLSQARMTKLTEFAEKNTIFDKKRLNKQGVIEMEAALNFALLINEEHFQCIKSTGDQILKALTCENNPETVRKADLVFIASLFRPGRGFKGLETCSEFLSVEEVFSSDLKEIFPEEFVEAGPVNFEEVLDVLEKSSYFVACGYFEMFKEFGKDLDLIVLKCVLNIVEIYNKSIHS